MFHCDKATGTYIAESRELEEEDEGGDNVGGESGDDPDFAEVEERFVVKKRLTDAQHHR